MLLAEDEKPVTKVTALIIQNFVASSHRSDHIIAISMELSIRNRRDNDAAGTIPAAP